MCSAPSTRSGSPRRSCGAFAWRSTAWSGCMPRWSSPTRTPTGAARCCRATWPRRRAHWTPSPPATAKHGSGCTGAGGACPARSGLFSLFPPIKAGLGLATRMPPRDLLRLARFALLPVRRLAEEEFDGAGGGLLLGGNALHADIGPEAPGSGFLGFLLCSLGQELGYPAVKGGAGQLTAALVRRLEARGGRVRCHTPVEALELRDRRAVAVRTGDGQVIPVGRAVVGAVDAITLYRRLIGEDNLPPAVVDDLDRFQFDNATVKVDWALDGGVPWEAEPARRAGTVHLTDSMDDLTMYNAQLACGVIPAKPLVVVGQMTTTDPTRSPAGTEALWAYAHVPQTVRGDAGGSITGAWTASEVQAIADRIEARLEAKAPGFRERILARHVLGPPAM